jgi:hypothetical protein
MQPPQEDFLDAPMLEGQIQGADVDNVLRDAVKGLSQMRYLFSVVIGRTLSYLETLKRFMSL